MATTQPQALPVPVFAQSSTASAPRPPAVLSGLGQPPARPFTYSIPSSVVPPVSPFPLLATQPSPTYSLRRVIPLTQGTQPPRFENRTGQRPAVPPASPPSNGKHLHKTDLTADSEQRKRVRQDGDPGSSEGEYEDLSARKAEADRTRPKMLLAPESPSKSVRSATRHLADPRLNVEREDSDHEMEQDEAGEMAAVDDEVVSSLWAVSPSNSVPDLRRLCDLVNNLMKGQAQLTQSIKQIDTRTRQYMDPRTNCTSRDGTYVSPPEAPPVINWDQSISFDEPAGRQRRAARQVLLMGAIRETIFRLLSRRSVHDPLPPPPPASLRVPRPFDFGIRWQESSKSVFNQMAAQIVAQKITYERPGMLTLDEAQELPSMVARHIKYLCRCYKEQNQDNAEEFAAERLKRCSAGTRKRQLLATRLQVLDMFPEHLGKHRRLIVHLGTDGTSSDEEDSNNRGTYRIKSKPQLSSKVTLLKRDLDHVYQLYFKGPGTKGML